jgi:S1-C subfamily serine protease
VVLQWFGDALAGARLETVSGGLARALDVREGVLVIRTVPGTATYDSGLREGDIVTRVGDTRVRSVTDLQRALTLNDERERERTLVIVRDRKERRLTLRW